MGKLLAGLRIFLLCLTLVILMLFLVPTHWLIRWSAKSRFRIRTIYCYLALWIIGARTDLRGRNGQTKVPSIFVCNHRSLLDPVINAKYIHAFFLSKAEVSQYPFLGLGSALTGAIFVDRSNKDSRAASREAIKNALSSGYNVLLYPEGTTNGLAVTKQFYKGSFEIAAEIGAPVIPVVVEYGNRKDYWTEGGLLTKSFEQFGQWRMRLGHWIGEPITNLSAMELLNESQRQIDEMIEQFHRDWANS